MWWYINQKILEPKVGDRRRVRKFAWFPKRIPIPDWDNDIRVWLEDYISVQVYYEYSDQDGIYRGWEEIETYPC